MSYQICAVTDTPESKQDDKGTKKYSLPIAVQEFDDNGELIGLIRYKLSYREPDAERMKMVWREGGTFWIPIRFNDFQGRKYAQLMDLKIFSFHQGA